MTKQDEKNIPINVKENERDNLLDLQEEIEQIDEEQEDREKEKENEKQSNFTSTDKEVEKLKELLSRNQADFNNYKMRNERDRKEMIFFLKNDILKKILPRLDDIERIVKNTPEWERVGALYEGLLILEKAMKRDMESLWVKSFESIWQLPDPHKHEVMTQIPSETPWLIVDEFEKWYMLEDKVLRVAKVIVWAE